jgi:hypothetical protein
MENERIIETGDPQALSARHAAEVSVVLDELGRLYFDRVRAMNTGDRMAVLEVEMKITTLKVKLAAL